MPKIRYTPASDPAGTAAGAVTTHDAASGAHTAAIGAHSSATDPHGDRAAATQAISNHDGAATAHAAATNIAKVARSTFSNEDKTWPAGCRFLAQVGTLDAARTVTLPAANSLPAGTELVVADQSGSVTTANTITIQRAGSDTVNGTASTVIAQAYGWRRFVTDGASAWVFDGGIARLSVAQTFTANQTAPALIASGLTGATAASRYVGATASGPPGSGTFAVGDFVVDQTGRLYVCTAAGSPGTWAVHSTDASNSASYVARTTDAGRRDVAAAVIDIFDRSQATASAVCNTGNLYVVFFTAARSVAVTQATVATSTTAAAATPSLIRLGLWTATDAGGLTAEIASTANDTGLLAATNTVYTKAFAAGVTLTEGVRYAFGMLVVSGAATPTVAGRITRAGVPGLTPVQGGYIGSLADLPTVFPAATTAFTNHPFARFS